MVTVLSWTTERVALLTEMRARGPKVIWEALNKLPGPVLTKSAVTGKRDRMFGVRQPKKTPEERTAMHVAKRQREAVAAKARRAKGASGHKPTLRIISSNGNSNSHRIVEIPSAGPFACREAADVVPKHLTLMELTDDTCRYPYGDSDFTFCGHEPKFGSPYCEQHHRICFNGIPTPKRAPFVDLGRGHGGIGRVA